MDVSVIIINYNTFDLTCSCIRSIKKFTVDIVYEIIVVDNASTERPAPDFLVEFPDLKLVANSENVGFARGNNIGIELASGQYILLLNSDAELLNNSLVIVSAFLKKNPDVAAASARLQYPDGRVQHNCQRFPSVKYQLMELLRLQKIIPDVKKSLFGPFFDYNSVAYPDWVWGTFFMFRRELRTQLPNQKLPDNFFMYVEDMQWCMEFRRLGFEIAFCPEAKVSHLVGGSSGKKEASMKVNLDEFMKLYYPPWKRSIIGALKYLLTSRYAA